MPEIERCGKCCCDLWNRLRHTSRLFLIYGAGGELTVVAAQNIDYSSAEEIEERITKAIEEGLEICKTF